MRRTATLLFVAAALSFAQVHVKRASLEATEKTADQRLIRVVESPFALLGPTRAMYVDGYGVVFSAELNLFPGPTLNPFHQSITKEDIARVRARKLERLPALRQSMRDIILSAAASLDEVPAVERIVVGVTLLHLSYEDISGMPAQIVMQGQRGRLVEAKLGRVPPDSVIKTQEF